MKTSKHLLDPVFMGHVAKLQAGETTRKQICEDLGIVMPELSRRFRSCGLLDTLKATKDRSGDHLFKGDPDNASAYAKARDFCLQHPTTPVSHVLNRAEFKGLGYTYLCRLVRQAKGQEEPQKPTKRTVSAQNTPIPAQNQHK